MRLVREGQGVRWEFDLAPPGTVVGRDRGCGVRISSPKVSRRHARLALAGDEIEVTDLGSRNGTFVNGVKVDRGVLRPGDLLKIGDVRFRLVTEGEAAAAAAPAPEAADVEIEAGDETPADEAFAPASNLPAIRPAASAEVVARGDRWYLRDPRTSRELEIVPVARDPRTGEAVSLPTAAPAPGPFGRRLDRRILLGAVAALAVIAGVAILKGKPPPPPPPPPTIAEGDYDKWVDAAVQRIRDGKELQGWTDKLQGIDRLLPARQTAKIWADLVPFFQGVDPKTYQGFRWDEVGPSLDEAEGARHATPAQQTFVREFKAFMARREQDEADLAAAEKAERLARQETSLDAFEQGAQKAIDRFQSIANRPGFGLHQEPARKGLGRVRAALAEKLLADADAKAAEAEKAMAADPDVRRPGSEIRALVAAAGGAIERAIPRLVATDPKGLEDRKAALERERDAREAFAEGRGLVGAGDEASGMERLEAIPAGTSVTARAREIVEDVKRRRASKAARLRAAARYMEGKGDEALGILKDAGISISEFEGKVKRVMASFQEAEAAEAAGDIPKARAAWDRILAMEADSGNWYRKEAQKRALAISPSAVAAKLYDQGKQAFEAGKWREARSWFRRARAEDSSQDYGRAELDKMQKEARLLLPRAAAIKAEKPDEARRLYERILDMVEEGDPLAETAKKRLAELEAPKPPEGG